MIPLGKFLIHDNRLQGMVCLSFPLTCKFSSLTKNKTPIEKLALHKESHICLVKMNTSVDYTGPSDNAPWLNTSLMTSPSPMLHVFQMLLGQKSCL